MTKHELPPPPAVGSPVDRGVGRLEPEREDFDDGWRDDDAECMHCGGDGADPYCDCLLPCPYCGGSW